MWYLFIIATEFRYNKLTESLPILLNISYSLFLFCDKSEFSVYNEVVRSKLSPFLWGAFFMALALALTLYLAMREKSYLEANRIASPDIPPGPAIAYFFGVVAVVGLVLYFIRVDRLRWVFRALFSLMFAWGVFIFAALHLPEVAAYVLAAVSGIAWLLFARVWLHDLLLLVTLAAAGSVYGFLFSPWTFMIFMLVISVYDVVAVRFGFMVWMADKLSESVALPAFVFPKQIKDLRWDLKNVRVGEARQQEPALRQYAVLGGGDIGLPLMLVVSVFFAGDLVRAVVVGVFALMGLMGAFLMQSLWFKGKPVPALPPIALLSLIGLLITTVLPFG